MTRKIILSRSPFSSGFYPASTLSVRWHPNTEVDSSSGCAEVQTPQTLGYLTLSVMAGVKHL